MANLWDRMNQIKQDVDINKDKDKNFQPVKEENNISQPKKDVPITKTEHEKNNDRKSINKTESLIIVDSFLKRTAMKKDNFLRVKKNIQDALIKEISSEELKNKANDPAFRREVKEMIDTLISKENLAITKENKENLASILLDDSIGLGPLEPLLQDPSISEIMVNSKSQIYVERSGKLLLTDSFFDDDAHILRVIDRILSPLNRHVDESQPFEDARLADGSRVNVIIPPLALKGPSIVIRKFSKDPYTVDDLIRFGTFTPETAQFLDFCVRAKLNMIVSGGTGSGKTTTLNLLSGFIPADERIVTIEDAAELQLRQPHVVTLESKRAGISGAGEITIRDLVRNSLRMRPDRIIVGECRGGEALDMLQAMNTGHDGSLTTGHANTPRDMLSRLETMVLMSGMELPVKAIREQISSAIDVIVQQSRLKDGSRKITHITEVQKMEGDTIVTQDIFVFKQTGIDEKGKIIGKLEPTGIRPSFMEKFEKFGIQIPNEVFYKK